MRRVVVTGLGAVTAIGTTVDTFWENIKKGTCGIKLIDKFDTTDYKAKVAATIDDFDPKEYMDAKTAKRMAEFCQYAVAATKQAIDNSGLDLEKQDMTRFGASIGSGIGALGVMEKDHQKLMEKGPNRVSPMMVPTMISNMAAGNVAIQFGLQGKNINVVTACASGAHSIGEAYRAIQCNEADVMAAGGAESAITELGVAGFAALTALSSSEDPKRASIPFDKERNGFVMGEGAGALILEDLESALNRGAKIYAEIVGYGSTCDAYHITSPCLDGDGAYRAMRDALIDADITSDKISYINAHGTSTEINDKVETLAIKKALGNNYLNAYVSSTKSMTGHLLGAAGAIEAIISIKSLQDNFVPATINYINKDDECDLNLVVNEGLNTNIEYSMSNSLGFGGHNGTLIFKKWR